MKKIFKKNQIIITALAIMIAAAGYINYSDSGLQLGESKEEGEDQETVSETADFDTVLSDIESLDQDLTDETAKAEEEMTPEGEEFRKRRRRLPRRRRERRFSPGRLHFSPGEDYQGTDAGTE